MQPMSIRRLFFRRPSFSHLARSSSKASVVLPLFIASMFANPAALAEQHSNAMTNVLTLTDSCEVKAQAANSQLAMRCNDQVSNRISISIDHSDDTQRLASEQAMQNLSLTATGQAREQNSLIAYDYVFDVSSIINGYDANLERRLVTTVQF